MSSGIMSYQVVGGGLRAGLSSYSGPPTEPRPETVNSDLQKWSRLAVVLSHLFPLSRGRPVARSGSGTSKSSDIDPRDRDCGRCRIRRLVLQKMFKRSFTQYPWCSPVKKTT